MPKLWHGLAHPATAPTVQEGWFLCFFLYYSCMRSAWNNLTQQHVLYALTGWPCNCALHRICPGITALLCEKIAPVHPVTLVWLQLLRKSVLHYTAMPRFGLLQPSLEPQEPPGSVIPYQLAAYRGKYHVDQGYSEDCQQSLHPRFTVLKANHLQCLGEQKLRNLFHAH